MLEPHLDCRVDEEDGVWTLAPHQRRELLGILGQGGLVDDPLALDEYAGDASPVKPVRPAAVVLPGDAAAVAAVLAFAERDRIPVTPRGGGSGKVGGAVPIYGGLVLGTHRLVGSVEVDRRSRSARVPAGVLLADVQEAVAAEGLAYPPDPGSAPLATLGGTIATNAGGPSSMKYGVTGDHVLAVEVALASGRRLTLGHLSPKGVVGLDLARLIVGSEGILGVVTGATLRLRGQAPARRALLALFEGPRQAMEGLGELVASGVEPRAAEFFDGEVLAALGRELAPPQGSGDAGGLGGRIAAALRALPGGGAALLVELDGRDEAIDADLGAAVGILSASGRPAPLVARSELERQQLWAVRAGMSRTIKVGSRYYVSEDVGLPPGRLPELVDFLAALRAQVGLRILSYGHAGDGNLHVNVLFDDLAARPEVDAAVGAIFQQVVRLGGTLSGEHGVGCAKLPWVGIEQGRELIALQWRMKAALDPKGILNPGKVLPRLA